MEAENEAAFGATSVSRLHSKSKIMGDKSPKATQKKSAQKQSKSNVSDQKKKQAIASKQAAGASAKKK
ncbi:MAG TPA: hypothetical protein VGC39_09095 [Candidatus Methylacidiphilales bacterium]